MCVLTVQNNVVKSGGVQPYRPAQVMFDPRAALLAPPLGGGLYKSRIQLTHNLKPPGFNP
jgi:hypothetical protein